MKRPRFNFQQKSSKKRSREDSDEDNAKKQKLEDDAKKKELRDSMDVVPKDDITIDVESLATKYPIERCPRSTQTGTRKSSYVANAYWNFYSHDDREEISSYLRNAFKDVKKKTRDEEEVTIDDIPLAVKSPSIVGWKIYKEGRKSYYQTIKADGKSQMYMIFSQMLKSFDREDLYKLVKAKYKSTRPVEDLDLLLWGDLKIFFEPHVEDKIYMLVEKKYPLTPFILSMMLEKKLIINYESKMAYHFLKFIMKQLKKYRSVQKHPPSVDEALNEET
ncbi:hypothetical protein Tco_0261933 [Tanacetum coccineum]